MYCGGCCRKFRTGRTPGKGGSIGRESHGFMSSKLEADLLHDIAGVAASASQAPLMQLVCQIGRRLASEWRIAAADTLAPSPMATGA